MILSSLVSPHNLTKLQVVGKRIKHSLTHEGLAEYSYADKSDLEKTSTKNGDEIKVFIFIETTLI